MKLQAGLMFLDLSLCQYDCTTHQLHFTLQRSRCKGVLDESNLWQSEGPAISATLVQNEDKNLHSPKVKMKKLKQLMYLPDGLIETRASLSRSLGKLSRPTQLTLFLTSCRIVLKLTN